MNGKERPRNTLETAFTLGFLLLLASSRKLTADETGTAVFHFQGNTYPYHYRVLEPREEVVPGEPGFHDLSSPDAAFKTMFTTMSNGDPAAWKDLWRNADRNPRFDVPNDELIAGWKGWLSVPHYLLYVVEYREQTIFVTERGEGGRFSRAKYFFKMIDGEYFLNRDLFEDPFARIVDDPLFDPVTGTLRVPPHALYEFEDLPEVQEVVDTATVPILLTDHTINSGFGYGLKSAEGVEQGKGLFLDGKGYILLPPSVPLSFYNNEFTITLWVKAGLLPYRPENFVGEDLYKEVIFSRGDPADERYLALEIRRRAGNIAHTIRFGLGKGENRVFLEHDFTLNKWNKVEIVWNKEDLFFKLNDFEKNTVKEPKPPEIPKVQGPFKRIRIGRTKGDPAFPFTGYLDQFSLSNETAK